ncbi:MAG TPA: DUF3175 domain-containing protein [Gammaproteobacteria bacterium]|jgi:hypothetical protein|nr:DUF3175 domain-containing protein [Gammaproteobacteria bacterium]
MAKKWSQEITENSRALRLEDGVFTWKDSKKIAKSLARSSLESSNRKSTPYGSAMAMLNFYINRAGKKLPSAQKKILHHAKDDLRQIFKKDKKKEK